MSETKRVLEETMAKEKADKSRLHKALVSSEGVFFVLTLQINVFIPTYAERVQGLKRRYEEIRLGHVLALEDLVGSYLCAKQQFQQTMHEETKVVVVNDVGSAVMPCENNE